MLFAAALLASVVMAAPPDTSPELAAADKLWTDQNFKEAAEGYSKFLESMHPQDELWHASLRLSMSRLRLQEYDDGVKAAEATIKRFAGSIREARAERVLGMLYLTLPHQGTEKGGKYYRGRWDQGIHKDSTKSDQKKAVEHLERARDLFAGLAADPGRKATLTEAERKGLSAERIACQFDLVAALTRFTTQDQRFYPGGSGEEEDPDDQTAGEDAEDMPVSRGKHHGYEGRGFRGGGARPRGIPVDEAGKPMFDPLPATWSSGLPAGQKVKFLLGEIDSLDTSENRDDSGLAMHRRAMLARARYGAHRLQVYLNWWDGGEQPFRDQVEKAKLSDLADGEVLTLLGTRIARLTLPPDEDILALLRSVVARTPKAKSAPESQYAIGLYYQSRQQFKEAIREFERIAELFPGSSRTGSAAAQIQRIRATELLPEQTGVQLSGDAARLPVTYRNTSKIRCVAWKLDFDRYLTEYMAKIESDSENADSGHDLNNLSYSLLSEQGKNGPRFLDYRGDKVAEWETAVNDAGDHRYAHADVSTPLTERGCYVVEAQCAGLNQPARALLLLSDLAVVRKQLKEKELFFTVDARSGQPVANAKLTHFQYWQRWEKKGFVRRERNHFYAQPREATSDAEGVSFFEAEQKFQSWPQIITIARGPNGSMAFAGVAYWSHYYSPSNDWSGRRTAVFTDRPVYRPLQTVKFKCWARDYSGGVYQPVRDRLLHIEVRDPKGNTVFKSDYEPTAAGGVDGQFKLEKTAPLGMYTIDVGGYGGAGNQFRVEEYKKPEFEVEVKIASDLARLGDVVKGKVTARYFFGAPVTKAKVNYKIFREDYEHKWTAPGYWDWLYGDGYGRWWYAYDWFPWWGKHGPRSCVWYPWWGTPPKRQRELVAEGNGAIGEDGTMAFEVDTQPALRNHPDKDHLYSIEAEVVDASRRTITGRGSLKVTREEFYAFVEVDKGYYEPNDQVHVTVKATTANDTPVASNGKLKVAAIRYTGERNAHLVEEPTESIDLATDGEGNLTATLKAGKSGQYKISYETQDSRGKAVVGAQVIWVRGADFSGEIYRFTDLEILTDKRTYRPGETAHLMINTSRPGVSVVFSHHADRGNLSIYKVIALPSKSTVIHMPIGKEDVPNFFVEATTVLDGKVLQEAREIAVPPQGSVMNLSVTADKSEVCPGEETTVRLKATTPDGDPVATEVALSVFDKSVTYIQPELTPDLRGHYWGQKRSHGFQMQSSLQTTFQPIGYRQDPVQYVDADPAADWFGSWGTHGVNWASDELEKDGGVMSFAAEGGAGGYAEKSRANGMADAMAPQAAAAPMASGRRMAKASGLEERKDARQKEEAPGSPPPPPPPPAGAQPAYQAAKVRSEFEDTAFWAPSLKTDEKGEATATFRLPENLTTWKVRALAMTDQARVGDGSAAFVTSKKFVLRLQAPRFFVERDRVVLSANLHNYLEKEKKAKVTISVPKDLMELSSPESQEVVIPAGKEARVDWEVVVKAEGFAVVKMEGLTDEESDAVQMGFPVLVHGIEKTVSKTGLLRPGGANFAEIVLDVPAERRPEASRLEVRFSPSLAGAMIEAVPYLLDFPYGCTEQTMSRFLPAVLVQRSLMGMGLSLEDLQKSRTNLDSQQLGDSKERLARHQPLGDKPIFSQKALAEIVASGLERIASFQLPSGGWGWWANDRPSLHLTAYVLWGLKLASDNDVAVDSSMLERGYQALERETAKDLAHWKENAGAWDDQAFLAHVLTIGKRDAGELLKLLFERRMKLSLYGKALLSLALRTAGRAADADLVLKNVRQYEKRDPENQTAYYDLPQDGWWYWWNNDIETHAWILKAILAKDPSDEAAPGLVKWLLNNRKNGTYWRSTRDTALAIAGLVDYMRASKEMAPDYTLRLLLDGKVVKEAKVTRETMFALDNKLTLTGDALTSGRHTLRVEREGTGAVYFSSYLTYFTKEENITAAGLEVKVDRKYFKLVRADKNVTTEGARLQAVSERLVRYDRVPLASGDKLTSGDLIEVELKLTTKNDYEYLVFEDFKPAGCEPVDLRSGARFGEICSNMELRDEKVAFFVTWLAQGDHLVKYRLRAEIPGTFHALPTKGWAMYAPEIRANADEALIGIEDKKE